MNEKTTNTQTRDIWLRLGVSVKVTNAEERSLLCSSNKHAADTLSKIIADGRAQINGNSCIPGVCIEEFNKKYDTDYCADDTSIQIDKPQPLSTNCKINDDDMKELRGQLIDIVEEYLEEKCVSDKYAVFIKDGDYDKLAGKFTETLKNWKLI